MSHFRMCLIFRKTQFGSFESESLSTHTHFTNYMRNYILMCHL